jgi:hypothetical protein
VHQLTALVGWFDQLTLPILATERRPYSSRAPQPDNHNSKCFPRELFLAFPPSTIRPPSLMLAASGKGFVTREQLQIDFDQRLTAGE